MINNHLSQNKSMEKGNFKNKRRKVISLIATFGVIFLVAIILVLTNLMKTNNSSVTETLTSVSGEETHTMANSSTYNIYGEEPFTEEYSIGAFAPASAITGISYGDGFAHVGTDADGSENTPDYLTVCVGTNTSKQDDVYRDSYGAFRMGTEVYDTRTYFWLVEGDDFGLWGVVGYGAYNVSQSRGDSFPDGYESQNVNTVIGIEIHFYEGGTLATSNPKEVPVKGIISMSDIDKDEGYVFDNGGNGVWLTENTTLVPGSEVDSSIYNTSTEGGWFGIIDDENNPDMVLRCQFESSATSPLTFKHFATYGWHSLIHSSTVTVTYHIVGEVPSGVTYPEDPIYVATYGTYTFEDALSVNGYEFTGWNLGSINGENVSGETISPVTGNVDVYGEFSMDISVRKSWGDQNDQDGLRPDNIVVTLYNNGVSTGKTLTLDDSNNWQDSFTDLEVSSNYTIRENFNNSEYISFTMGNASSGFTIINTHVPETIDIPVSKSWNDSDDQDGLRPDNITVTLYANGRSTGNTLTLNSSNNWQGTFNNVAKYEDGEEIEYTIRETSVSGYMSATTGNVTDGFSIINTHFAETINIPVSKVWNDNNDQDGLRPTSVTVRLYANGSYYKLLTLRSSSNWTGTFTNVPRYENGEAITYTIQEVSVTGYTSSVSGSATTRFTITNTHTPETIDIPVSKVWNDNNDQDGIRPTSVTVTLYANGRSTGKTLTLNNTNNWKNTFNDVDRYEDGEEITYTVQENTITGYTASVSGSEESGYTITNTHTPETIDIPVSKVWNDNNDQDGLRATSVTVTLYANGRSTEKTVTLNNTNNWRNTFNDVDRYEDGEEITYTVQENTVTGYTASVSGSIENGFTITNTHTPETIDISVSKEWNDNDNQDGIRPTSVNIILYKDGVSTGRGLTLNSSNNWEDSFTDLPKYEDGEEINYTIRESTVTGYTASVSGSIENGFTVTNTHTPEVIDISVEKEWNDNNDQDGLRPTSVNIILYKGGVSTGRGLTLNSSNNWEDSFTDLPKYEDGEEINYTIRENTVTGYTGSITGSIENGFVVTNTHTPETIDIPVSKVWNDNNDQDGLRATSVTVTLYANGRSTGKTVTLNSTNNWRNTFNDVDRYEDGEEITYTVQENTISGYTYSVTGNMTNGFVVTNTHTPETVDIPVEKVWDDNNDSKGNRPENITVQLTADVANVAGRTVLLSDANDWTYTFEDLPKYTSGREIEYSIIETETNDGDLEYYEAPLVEEVNGTIRVTNSYKLMNTDVEATINKTGTISISSSSEKIDYDINYTATVEDYIGDVEVTIVDYLPYGIEIDSSDIDGGEYSETNHSITWKIDLGHVNTYEEGAEEIEITKNISVVFNGLDASRETITNNVTGTINLYETGETNTVEDSHDTEINIEGNVITRYLEEGTDEVLEAEEETTGKVGTGYTTEQKEITGYDYVRTEGNETGEYVDGTTYVTYYYKLKNPVINSNITKTTDLTVINETSQKIPYEISYNASIIDYRGNAVVTIVDYLPYELDLENSELNAGSYDRENKTITWVETISDIDTYTDSGSGVINITKNIELTFINIDTTESDLENNAVGTIRLDTPEKEDTVEEDEIIPTNYLIDIPVEKVWDDNNNSQGNRPDSVTITLTADGENVAGRTVLLSDANDWTYTFEDLPKYTSGREIEYSIIETETNDGDLEYYEAPLVEEVNGTIRVTNSYKLMNTDVEATINKTGTISISSSSEKVDYDINYTATVEDYIGDVEVTIVDYLPYGIEIDSSDIDGGEYSETNHSITWKIDLGHVNTYEEGVEKIDITKNISVVFNGLDASRETITNNVTGTINLYETGETNTVEDSHDTEINIEGNVITRYLEEGTDEVLEAEEETTGKVGTGYTTEQKEITGYDYVRTEGNGTGEYVDGTIYVTYYYKLKDPVINSNISKTTTTDLVTEIDQKVPYTISYNANITDYRGNAVITIVDYLPYELDLENSNIANGTYNQEEKTITWIENISNIDTYENVSNNINITKNIELTFINIDVTGSSIGNNATGTIRLDTPEKEETVEEGEILPTEYLVDVPVEKVWVDNNNSQGNRPENVTITLTADGVNVAGRTVLLSDDNNWTYTFEDLPKYTDAGQEIEYSVIETETTEGDLEYYEEAEVTKTAEGIVVTNNYKDMNSNIESSIEKSGTTSISSSSEKVDYTINYTATVDEYIGTGRVTIVDYLPYGIEIDSSDIADGEYSEENHTITWTEELGHINTYEEGAEEINITKNISVVFNGLDASRTTMSNRVEGTIELEETGAEETVEDTHETEISVEGKVITRYLEEGTDEVLAVEEETIGKVGTGYTTEQKEITGYDYVRTEGNTTGEYIEGTTYVTYYYKLKDPVIDSNITKTTTTIEVNDVNQVIPYEIEYSANITDYKGNAVITIIDYLPYELKTDEKGDLVEGIDLAEGTYDTETKTITWTESISNIDTYSNTGSGVINITKNIELIFGNIDITQSNIENNAVGTIKLDTPEKEETVEEGEILPTEYLVDVPVEKVWDDNNNSQGNRPDNVTITLTADGVNVAGRTVILSNDNNWAYTFEDLPKYTDAGQEIEYSVIETETTEGDLEYYEEAEVTKTAEGIVVTNNYKDMNTNIESSIDKTGTTIITTSTDKVTYYINYSTTIDEYIGEGKIIVVDYLPYEIDLDNSEIANGTYNSNNRTITWEVDIEHFNTDEEGQKTIEFNKTITLAFNEIDITQETVTNRVTGTVELYETDSQETVEDTHDTEIAVEGNVITRYLEEGTDEVLAVEEETIGKVGTGYTTEQKEITGYDYVRTEGNATGEYIEGTIYVTYYYELKEPIINSNITKVTDTLEVTEIDQIIPYNINYSVNITDYRGNAVITIVDYLPYELKTDESGNLIESINLDGGIYDSEAKTITWTETVENIDTYTNSDGSITISRTKNIELTYAGIDVNSSSINNNAVGTIKLDTPEKEDTVEEGEKLPVNFEVSIPVEKVWNDNDNIKKHRPENVTVWLTGYGMKIEGMSVILNESNGWKATFENLPKYTLAGEEIEYNVIEEETTDGDLEYYEEPVIEKLENVIRITNNYKLMETNLDSSIDKTGTENITSSNEEVNYQINYTATIDSYIGEVLVTIVDYLPYQLKTDESGNLAENIDLDGGTYDPEAKTIIWTERIEHINTFEEGSYNIDTIKNIKIVYSDLDATQDIMTNRVTGTIDLYETEQTNTVEDIHDTEINIPGKVIVSYVDKETGEEIAQAEEINGKVGDDYTTEYKEIFGYTYIENSGNTTGKMTEEDIYVIYYYERTEGGKVTATYIDEEKGEEIADKEEYTGFIGDEYITEQKEIENYEFVRIEGEATGEFADEEKEVVYVYKKIPARVIVRYLEKDNTPDDDSDNIVLAEEEIIEGYCGDEYKTSRKEIENYQPEEPEPNNPSGNMTKEDIYITYYYEKIPSGIVTAIYVDEETGEEITYVDETTGENNTYREEMQGYVGEEYMTNSKDIPYYTYVEERAPENAEGIYTQEDILITYYYKKKSFNIGVEKNLTKIVLNGAEQEIINGKINKVEIPVGRVSDSTLEIEYSIVVANNGKIQGTTDVIERLPEYFEVIDGTSEEWEKENDGTLKLTAEIDVGESKEYKVVLRWTRGSSNFGSLTNIVELANVDNPAGFEETTIEDNISEAELVLSVKSGLDRSMTIILLSIGVLIITAGGIVLIKKKVIGQ